MPRAYYSSVLNHSAPRVWQLVRDFNDYPRYIDGVTESIIEEGQRGDEVGAVRRFRSGGAWRRQRLTDHSDADRCFSYVGMEPFEFPTHSSAAAPAPVDYAGTLRLTPIVDGDRTFIEWFVEFECAPDDTARWKDLLMRLIPHWVGSLSRALEVAEA